MWYCNLFSTEDGQEHHFYVVIHHLISDGKSLAFGFIPNFLMYCSELEQGQEKPASFKEGLLYKTVDELIPVPKQSDSEKKE
mmetsp:Transcript_39736/g.35463  ORF Transcript_39736/g.35463 Transcript_39736/m.35463 type:complete len:82 (+) Transcript_39736:305-550(+)